MSSISIQINHPQAAQVAARVVGGSLGQAVATALGAYQTTQQLQSLFGQLQTAFEKLGQLSGVGGQGQGFGAGPGCVSPNGISIAILQNPMQALMGGGELQKHAKAPLVGNDSQWPAFSDAANNRCSGHRPLFDGTNPWNKQGAARDEAALVGWAMQQNDTVQYDTDRKMFYQADTAGNRTDVMSLDDLKKTADGAGGLSPNNGVGLQAVGKALAEASKAAEQPSLQKLSEAIGQLLRKLTEGIDGAMGAAAQAGVQGGAGAASGTGQASNFASAAEAGWSKMDSMMEQAEKLMNSDKPSDQLKAQQLMQKAQRMFEMISKMMEQRSQLMSRAVQAIK